MAFLAALLLALALFQNQPSDAPSGTQARSPGLTLRLYEIDGPLSALPRIAPDQTPNLNRLVPTVALPPESEGLVAPLAGALEGWLAIETEGDYRFRLTSDDGSRLTLGDELLIDHDGAHGATQQESRTLPLSPGDYPIRIDYFDAGGRRALALEWQRGPTGEFLPVPGASLSTELDLARVTSPGKKRLLDQSRPGDGRALEGVHPGWRVERLPTPGFEPKVSCLCFLPDGRLVVGCFAPLQRDDTTLPDIESKVPDKLYALSNVLLDSPNPLAARPCADGLFEPLGLCVLDGQLYVSQRLEVTRLTDRDGDGFFETHETIASGWEGWNYHQFTFQLVPRNGRLYTALSTAMAPPGWEGMGTNSAPNGVLRGAILEIDPLSKSWSAIAGGARTPNGLGLGPANTLLYLDNQGTWMPTSQLAEVLPGSFFGHYNNTRFVPNLKERFPEGGRASVYADRLRAPAALYLPHGELSNSPTEPVLIESGPFEGQVLIGELTGGGIRRACFERVGGVLQGAVMRFTQGFEVGINRLCFGPDGALYVGGIGAQGNWNWRGTQSGLQRLVPTGQAVFEIESVRSHPDGFLVRFTQPFDPRSLVEAGALSAKSWSYQPTAAYGGDKQNERQLTAWLEPWMPADELPSGSGSPSRATARNGAGFPGNFDPERELLVRVEGLEAGTCVHLRVDARSLAGESIWSPDAYFTLNRLPSEGTPHRLPGTTEFAAVDQESAGSQLLSGEPPMGNASVLIGQGIDAQWRRVGDTSSPTLGHSQDELIASGGERVLRAGEPAIETRATWSRGLLYLELRFDPADGRGDPTGLEGFALNLPGGFQLVAAERTSPSEDLAASRSPGPTQVGVVGLADGAWHRIVAHFSFTTTLGSSHSGGVPELSLWVDGRLRIAGLLGQGPATPRPLGVQPASANGSTLHLRHAWIRPLQPPRPGDFGPWRELLPDPANGQLPGFAPRGRNAAFEWRQEADEWLLVGTSKPNTPNTFLTSQDEYGDFELEFEARQDPRLNSGVQIRSQVEGGFENRAGRLLGPQVELDPSPRAYTAGIYEEGGRGWLFPLTDNPAARAAYRVGEWNHLRVLAQGSHIQTWLNGVPAADLVDDGSARSGHLGFQVHGVGGEAQPLEVAWRRLRIRSR